MEKIFLDNKQYRDWTLINISEDFGKTEDDEEWDFVEITDLGNGKINFVAIMDFQRDGSIDGKEAVYDVINIARPARTFEELKRDILIFSSFYTEKFELVE